MRNAFIPGLVSIVVPVYNAERQLGSCVESALGQTYPNIELLLIDDGSTDESGRLCDEYARRDSRVTVEHPKNGGPASARNLGIARSNGEFLFFLDADDRIEANALAVLVENQKQTRADLVIGDFSIDRGGPQCVDPNFLFPADTVMLRSDMIDRTTDYLKKPTAYAPLTYVWGKLFFSSVIKRYNVLFKPEQRIFEDIDLNIRYLQYADSVSYVRKKLYTYTAYQTLGATASGLQNNPFAYKAALNTIQTFLRASGVPSLKVKKDIGNAHVYFAIRIMVALFRYDKPISIWKAWRLIASLVNDPDVRNNLAYYSPATGDSRTIPHLIRLRLTAIIMAVCLYKARKRPTLVPQSAT